MAEFCQECSIELFGKDLGDFKGLITPEEFHQGLVATVLCEGCGRYICVDYNGARIGKIC